MGVSAFYRWLLGKYPSVRSVVNEDDAGLEFDHLYLDMHAVIHPCFHSESHIIPPTTFEEIFESMYAYIDRLFSIVRPRKLLYLAMDGVAPRAKINQQRCRRFRAAKEKGIADEKERKLREKYESMGKKILPVLESQVSDSNVITPGTDFMFELSNALKSYVVRRLESDPGWKAIKVVVSDATVPDEAEHKIMSFIRTLRSFPGYDPNTRHCIYGMDADLIMLALASREIHFSVLREDANHMHDQKPISESTLFTTIKRAGFVVQALDKPAEDDKKPFNIRDQSQSILILPQHYEFVHVWILREYLELDMQIIDPPDNFVFDIERIIDDFIFMCFFMGNDFLPHVPTLQMHERGINLLMHVYKNEFKNLGGYLVDMQLVNDPNACFIELKRVEKFILSVGDYEDQIFEKRAVIREEAIRSASRWKDGIDEQNSEVCIKDVQCPKVSTGFDQNDTIDGCSYSLSDIKEMVENTMELKEELKNNLYENADTFRDSVLTIDKVKFGSSGWKQRYYKEKFSVEDPKETEILRKEIVRMYTEGLCWVLMYYFSGIPSWNWFYPYYYVPVASELKGIDNVNVKFHKGSPLKPFDQLMAVLPPKSAQALPEAYQDLMTSNDSKIAEFYPWDYDVDMDGKRFKSEGICKVPFIDEEKLLNATCKLESKIEIHEAKRNVEGTDHLYWRGSKSCANGIWDYIVQHSENLEESRHSVHENEAITCCNMKLPSGNLRAPRLLEGVQLPEKTIFEKDLVKPLLWHVYRRPINRCRFRPQQWQRKAETDEHVIHKHAGTGWCGAGRGKGLNSNFQESYSDVPQNHLGQTGDGQSSTSSLSRGWFKQPPTSVSYMSTSMENLRTSRANTNNWHDRTTPHSNQNGGFWPSRSRPDTHQNATWHNQRPALGPVINENLGCPTVSYGRGQGSRAYSGHNKDSERW